MQREVLRFKLRSPCLRPNKDCRLKRRSRRTPFSRNTQKWFLRFAFFAWFPVKISLLHQSLHFPQYGFWCLVRGLYEQNRNFICRPGSPGGWNGQGPGGEISVGKNLVRARKELPWIRPWAYLLFGS